MGVGAGVVVCKIITSEVGIDVFDATLSADSPFSPHEVMNRKTQMAINNRPNTR